MTAEHGTRHKGTSLSHKNTPK